MRERAPKSARGAAELKALNLSLNHRSSGTPIKLGGERRQPETAWAQAGGQRSRARRRALRNAVIEKHEERNGCSRALACLASKRTRRDIAENLGILTHTSYCTSIDSPRREDKFST